MTLFPGKDILQVLSRVLQHNPMAGLQHESEQVHTVFCQWPSAPHSAHAHRSEGCDIAAAAPVAGPPAADAAVAAVAATAAIAAAATATAVCAGVLLGQSCHQELRSQRLLHQLSGAACPSFLVTQTCPFSTLQVSLQHVLVKALLWLISSTPPSKLLMAAARAPSASLSR